MLAMVAEVRRGRVCLSATPEQVVAAESATASEYPDTDLPEEALGFRVQKYGIQQHWQMFTTRQLSTMVTLSDLVRETSVDVRRDALATGLSSNEVSEYVRSVTMFLALALDRCASFNNSLCRWNGNQTVFIFTRAAIPMLWDFSEANIMGEKAVCWDTAVDICASAIETISPNSSIRASARQIDIAAGTDGLSGLLVSTDPP
jgi:putative DNA methylase